ncbi:MAG: ATP-grasp domain-containing protein [Chlamydiota bacterium]
MCEGGGRLIAQQKKILLTGARSIFTLDLARRLNEQGHRVYTAESMRLYLCRFSNAIEKHFTVPSPRFQTQAFLSSLVDIAQRENIDYIIPNFEEIFYLAKGLDQFPDTCQIFCPPYQLLNTLHNKWLFNQTTKKWGFETPESCLITHSSQLNQHPLKRPYLLKPCYSRSALRVIRVSENDAPPTIDIHRHNPWIAQEYLSGKKFCSHSIIHKGNLSSHVVYPVDFAINQSSSLNFEAIDHSAILDWVERFAKQARFTGQMGIDFIEQPNGKLYAIECNPRGTSGLHLFHSKDQLADIFFNQTQGLIIPEQGRKRQIGLAMAVYGWKSLGSEKKLSTFLKKLLTTRDVIFSSKDIKPWLGQLIIYPSYIWKCLTLRKSLPAMFTFDLDWNGEQLDLSNFSSRK